MTSQAITSAAHAVAAAEAQYDRAREGLVKAEAGWRQVTERIDALEVERTSIAARRRDGKGHAEDGGRLELIRVDLEDLAGLLRAQDEKVATAMQPVNAATGAVQVAQQRLGQIERETMEAALIEHAAKLDALMLETLQQIAALHVPLGRGKPVWCPSVPLLAEFRRLAAAAGRL